MEPTREELLKINANLQAMIQQLQADNAALRETIVRMSLEHYNVMRG